MTPNWKPLKALARTEQTADRALIADAVAPTILAVLLGTFILFGVGFANSSVLHNAAHDTRHSVSFPCH